MVPSLRRATRLARLARTALAAVILAAPASACAQAAPPAPAPRPAPPAAVTGWWDLTVTGADGQVYPAWIEIMRSGHRSLVGRMLHAVGNARPIGHVEWNDGTIRFAIPPQWDQDTAFLRVEGRLAGDRMTGTMITPAGERHTWTAVRAPRLARTAPPVWGEPVALFNGRDLSGWKVVQGPDKWRVVDGVLTSAGGGGNLVSERTFEDFRLQAEFRYPAGSNSGIYLRGRYEVQIEDSPRDVQPTSLQVGGVYGYLPPNENAARAPGEWQTFDITLVGRRVTVVLNGKTIIADAVIPGITGGALDSNEGAPGPIMIQGDHGPVEFRRIVVTPAR